MGTTAQKLAAVAASKASIAAALTARGITPPTPFKDYGDAVRMLSRIWDAEVEYVESTGTQFVDTGVVTSSISRIVMRFVPLAGGNYDMIAGARNGSDNTGTLQIRCGAIGKNIFNGAPNSTAIPFIIGSENSVDITTGSRTVAVNGASVTLSDARAVTVSHTLPIMCLYAAQNTPSAFAWCRILSVGIYNDVSTLVRDFVPVRVGTVGYLFDRVSGQLFGNAGTGAFVIGPDKT